MTRTTDEQIAEWRLMPDDIGCLDEILDALEAERSRADELRKERDEAWIRLAKIGQQSHAILRLVDGRDR